MTEDATETRTDEDEDQFRAMRTKANEHDKAEARAAAAERKLAFVEAGISITDPRATYFVKGYEGDLTPEAIRAEAHRAGVIEAPEGPSPEEQEGHRQVIEASAGAPPVGDTSLMDDLNAVNDRDPLAAEKIYAIMQKHGKWPEREY